MNFHHYVPWTKILDDMNKFNVTCQDCNPRQKEDKENLHPKKHKRQAQRA